MKKLTCCSVLITLGLLGCRTFPIASIGPDLSRIKPESEQRIPVNVGYYISPADMAKGVTTAGGASSKVHYFPYRSLAPALNKVLSNRFQEVFFLDSLTDKTEILENHIQYIFVPHIETDSVGRWNWPPPTWFKVDLDCKALDPDGNMVWQRHLVGEGKWVPYSYITIKYEDLPVAASLASEDAFTQLQRELAKAEVFTATQTTP